MKACTGAASIPVVVVCRASRLAEKLSSVPTGSAKNGLVAGAPGGSGGWLPAVKQWLPGASGPAVLQAGGTQTPLTLILRVSSGIPMNGNI